MASATPEQEVLGSNFGSDKVLLGFSSRNSLVAVMEFRFVPNLWQSGWGLAVCVCNFSMLGTHDTGMISRVGQHFL